MLTPVRPHKMQSQELASAAALPLQRPDPANIAVLLNQNARHVTDRVARKMQQIVGKDHVFITKNLEEAEAFSREVVQRGYGTIVSGGGDGTLMQTVNLVYHYIHEANSWRQERHRRFGERQALLDKPRFAFLKLGTGNGMCDIVGAGRPDRDLRNIVDLVPGRTQRLPLIEQEGERFFFGGAGYDSQVLDDYNGLKAKAKNWLFKRLMQNVTGYLMAIFARTAPRLVMGRGEKLEIRVVNRGRGYYVDPRRGDYVDEIEPGATLFEGRAGIVSAGTVPFYGYGFKVFPFARMMPGMMNLRISNLGPMHALPFIRSLWKGTFRNPGGLFDFLVEDVVVEMERPFPFQHSGDAQGLRDRLEFKIAEEDLELVDLHRPRPSH